MCRTCAVLTTSCPATAHIIYTDNLVVTATQHMCAAGAAVAMIHLGHFEGQETPSHAPTLLERVQDRLR